VAEKLILLAGRERTPLLVEEHVDALGAFGVQLIDRQPPRLVEVERFEQALVHASLEVIETGRLDHCRMLPTRCRLSPRRPINAPLRRGAAGTGPLQR